MALQPPPQMPELPLGTLEPGRLPRPRLARAGAATHPDATTVDTAEARTLLESGAALAVDVMAAVERPAAAGEPGAFIPNRPRRHIPGSIWLPNVGYDEADPVQARWYAQALARLEPRGSATAAC